MHLKSPTIMRRCISEFIGTFGLVFIGVGAIIVDFTSGGQITHLGVGLVFGFVVAAMIYATGHISGGHINPAVTLGFALSRHFPWKWVPHYWSSQLLGAAAACLVLRALFGDVANMGATLPEGSVWVSALLEGILTFFLMFVIMAVTTDTRTIGKSAAIAIGATVALEAISMGPISGASMNPARSFGSALVGWTWMDHWAYWVGPIGGAALASVTYWWLRGENSATSDGDGDRLS